MPPAPIQIGCRYTQDMLLGLLNVANIQEKSTVQSQLNNYNFDCNYFQALVLPIFQKYNIPTN